MCSDFAIRVQGLSKSYHIYDKPQDRLKQSLWRGRKQFYREFWALRDVSFEVAKGETIGIIGRNGSGKSTLLQMIAGTLTPTAGAVEVNGRVAALLELGSGFNPDFTGRENVFMNGAILGFSESEIAARFDEIASFADIGDFIDQPIKTYSSGMMVRLAFAVSVCVEPDILIVDEALSVGDMAFQFKCMQRLDRLVASGTTLLFVSHDLVAVKSFCNRAIYLSKGVSLAQGSASDMAELYMMDTRKEQNGTPPNASGVIVKPVLGRENAVAFGTRQGRVVSASFLDTSATEAIFSTGDEIRVQIEVEYDESVDKPAVSLLLQDSRTLNIAGRYVRVTRSGKEGQWNHATLHFSFNASLNAGSYFLTVRLERRGHSDSDSFPIDKQVAALSFQIFRPPQMEFFGIVDMPFECRQI